MYSIYRIERDGSETLIGFANYLHTDGQLLVNADRDNIDFEAGYHAYNLDSKTQKGSEQDGSDDGDAQVQESAEGDGI